MGWGGQGQVTRGYWCYMKESTMKVMPRSPLKLLSYALTGSILPHMQLAIKLTSWADSHRRAASGIVETSTEPETTFESSFELGKHLSYCSFQISWDSTTNSQQLAIAALFGCAESPPSPLGTAQGVRVNGHCPCSPFPPLPRSAHLPLFASLTVSL